MNWLDVVLLLILAISVAMSFRKGLSHEVIGLVAVVVALILGIWFYGTAGSFLLRYVNSRSMANLAGFLAVFCGVMCVGGLVSWIVGKFLRVTGLSIFDHLLGAGFGLARGTLISVALLLGIMAFSPQGKPPVAVVDSHMAPYVVRLARVVVSVAPRELKDAFQNTYNQAKSAWRDAVGQGIGTVPRHGKGK